MRLILGIILLILAQSVVFFQLFAPLKYGALKNNWWLYGIALPAVWLFHHGTNICAEELGEMWGVRIISFVAGIITFAIFNYFIFEEGISMKSGVCLGLAFMIVGIQILWK
jgi:hypothetical protein